MTRSILSLGICFVFAAACSCGGDNTVNSPDGAQPLAYDDAYNNTVPSTDTASTERGALIDSVAVADTIYVDLAGTRIRLVNSSGGNLIAANKTLIILADWNIHAWREQASPPPDYRGLPPPEGVLYKNPVDITSLEWRNHIDAHWEFSLQCAGVGQAFSGLGRLYGGMIRFTGEPFAAQGESHGTCMKGLALTIHDISRVRQSRDTKAVVIVKNNTFQLQDTAAFTAPELRITYHPVSEDSSMIATDAAWLEAVIDDRRGYAGQISRAFPFANELAYHGRNFIVGAPLVVPVDPQVRDWWNIANVLDAIQSVAPLEPTSGQAGRHTINLHVAVVPQRVNAAYSSYNQATNHGGIAYLGMNHSAVYHGKDELFYADPAGGGYMTHMLHEIGHNFGLIHTQDNTEYPLYPSVMLDRDGYHVETLRSVSRVDRTSHVDLMASTTEQSWVSEYTWNQIVYLIQPDLRPNPPLAAKRSGPQIITWTDDCH